MQNTKTYFCKSALVEIDTGQSEWRNDVVLSLRDDTIIAIDCDRPCPEEATDLRGIAIPSIPNVHSHAFQRGFAGLSEYRTDQNDSFWTWRKLMYEFVLKLTPDDAYIIARQLYLEMIQAGYSWVGEFHYLHNAESGAPYANPAEMSDAVLQAASDTGIGICLLPVLYQRSGFGTNSAGDDQRRFVMSSDRFQKQLLGTQADIASEPNATLGFAFHSLRAVSPEEIATVLEFRKSELPGCPVHIHVAEQTQEVDDCLLATGKRPVDYLLSLTDVDRDWCLIHATHLNDDETKNLAKTGATVGLCPTTEANLGDGFFPAESFLNQNGRFSIGSDSHCSIDFRDEMRTLEYGQRLLHRQRAILGTESQSVGRRIFTECARSGGRAIGVPTGTIAIGSRADWMVIDDQHPTIAGASEDRMIDRLIFSNSGNPIKGRVLGGQPIDNDRHVSMMRESATAFADLNRRLLK